MCRGGGCFTFPALRSAHTAGVRSSHKLNHKGAMTWLIKPPAGGYHPVTVRSANTNKSPTKACGGVTMAELWRGWGALQFMLVSPEALMFGGRGLKFMVSAISQTKQRVLVMLGYSLAQQALSLSPTLKTAGWK